MDNDDLYHTDLLPELRNLIRCALNAKDRFRCKRVCKKWNEEETFRLPSTMQAGLYHDCYNCKGAWETRRRLLLEWLDCGGLTWKPLHCYAATGYNTKMVFPCYWHVPCPHGCEHLLAVRGVIRMQQYPTDPETVWIYKKSYPSVISIDSEPLTSTTVATYGIGTATWTLGFNGICFGGLSCPELRALHHYTADNEKYTLAELLSSVPPRLRAIVEGGTLTHSST